MLSPFILLQSKDLAWSTMEERVESTRKIVDFYGTAAILFNKIPVLCARSGVDVNHSLARSRSLAVLKALAEEAMLSEDYEFAFKPQAGQALQFGDKIRRIHENVVDSAVADSKSGLLLRKRQRDDAEDLEAAIRVMDNLERTASTSRFYMRLRKKPDVQTVLDKHGLMGRYNVMLSSAPEHQLDMLKSIVDDIVAANGFGYYNRASDYVTNMLNLGMAANAMDIAEVQGLWVTQSIVQNLIRDTGTIIPGVLDLLKKGNRTPTEHLRVAALVSGTFLQHALEFLEKQSNDKTLENEKVYAAMEPIRALRRPPIDYYPMKPTREPDGSWVYKTQPQSVRLEGNVTTKMAMADVATIVAATSLPPYINIEAQIACLNQLTGLQRKTAVWNGGVAGGYNRFLKMIGMHKQTATYSHRKDGYVEKFDPSSFISFLKLPPTTSGLAKAIGSITRVNPTHILPYISSLRIPSLPEGLRVQINPTAALGAPYKDVKGSVLTDDNGNITHTALLSVLGAVAAVMSSVSRRVPISAIKDRYPTNFVVTASLKVEPFDLLSPFQPDELKITREERSDYVKTFAAANVSSCKGRMFFGGNDCGVYQDIVFDAMLSQGEKPMSNLGNLIEHLWEEKSTVKNLSDFNGFHGRMDLIMRYFLLCPHPITGLFPAHVILDPHLYAPLGIMADNMFLTTLYKPGEVLFAEEIDFLLVASEKIYEGYFDESKRFMGGSLHMKQYRWVFESWDFKSAEAQVTWKMCWPFLKLFMEHYHCSPIFMEMVEHIGRHAIGWGPVALGRYIYFMNMLFSGTRLTTVLNLLQSFIVSGLRGRLNGSEFRTVVAEMGWVVTCTCAVLLPQTASSAYLKEVEKDWMNADTWIGTKMMATRELRVDMLGNSATAVAVPFALHTPERTGVTWPGQFIGLLISERLAKMMLFLKSTAWPARPTDEEKALKLRGEKVQKRKLSLAEMTLLRLQKVLSAIYMGAYFFPAFLAVCVVLAKNLKKTMRDHGIAMDGQAMCAFDQENLHLSISPEAYSMLCDIVETGEVARAAATLWAHTGSRIQPFTRTYGFYNIKTDTPYGTDQAVNSINNFTSWLSMSGIGILDLAKMPSDIGEAPTPYMPAIKAAFGAYCTLYEIDRTTEFSDRFLGWIQELAAENLGWVAGADGGKQRIPNRMPSTTVTNVLTVSTKQFALELQNIEAEALAHNAEEYSLGVINADRLRGLKQIFRHNIDVDEEESLINSSTLAVGVPQSFDTYVEHDMKRADGIYPAVRGPEPSKTKKRNRSPAKQSSSDDPNIKKARTDVKEPEDIGAEKKENSGSEKEEIAQEKEGESESFGGDSELPPSTPPEEEDSYLSGFGGFGNNTLFNLPSFDPAQFGEFG